MSTLPGFLTVHEAAAAIGVSHSQVTRYLHQKRIEALKIGQQFLIPENALKSFERPKMGNPNLNANRKKTKK